MSHMERQVLSSPQLLKQLDHLDYYLMLELTVHQQQKTMLGLAVHVERNVWMSQRKKVSSALVAMLVENGTTMDAWV